MDIIEIKLLDGKSIKFLIDLIKCCYKKRHFYKRFYYKNYIKNMVDSNITYYFI
jgi:hypothetical protein